MIAAIGHYGLLFSGGLSCLSLLLMIKRTPITVKGLKTSLCFQFYGLFIAFTSLVYAFVVTDFSVITVALNTHKSSPLIYKIAAAWSTHEGSILLWALIQAGYGAFYSLRNHSFAVYYEHKLLSVINIVNAFFSVFIIYTSNPLTRLDITPQTTGRGLNPLLEDPLLAIHPPLLYVGYIGLLIPFSAALAQSTMPQDKTLWARSMRPWVLSAWVFLTMGIILGSFWAYNELGWGGWWFWDPVENVALIPWLVTTGLLHVLIVLQKQGYFYKTALGLGILSFLTSLLGTFLVRSGIISSIHAFAHDPARGNLIFGFIALLSGYALFSFSRSIERSPAIRPWVSRAGLLGIQGFSCLGLALLIALGTFYPLFYQAFTQRMITIGPGFYNTVLVPLFLICAAWIGLVPYSRWGATPQISMQLVSLGVFCGGVFCLTWVFVDSASLLYALGLGIGAWIVLSSCQAFRWSFKHLAMTGAHLAVGVFLIAASTEQHGLKTQTYLMTQGEEKPFGAFSITLDNIDYLAAPYFRQERAYIKVRKQEQNTVLTPEKRFYPLRETVTTETAVWRRWDGDLRLFLGDIDPNGFWGISISWHPMIGLLWTSGLLLVLCGILAFIQAVRSYRQQSLHKHLQ